MRIRKIPHEPNSTECAVRASQDLPEAEPRVRQPKPDSRRGRANPASSVSNSYAAASFLFMIFAITTKPPHANTMVTANGIHGLPMMPART